MENWDLPISITVLCFSLPARPYSHPADELAQEMYLLTSINPARQGIPVDETSFTMNESMEKEYFLFLSVNNTTI